MSTNNSHLTPTQIKIILFLIFDRNRKTTMMKYIIIKFVISMLVIDSTMINIGAVLTHNNGGHGEKVSLGCIASCGLSCARTGELLPACMAACILIRCTDSPIADPDGAKQCSSACAQSVCARYSGNVLFPYK